ncbi:MAG: CDP-alcohol phosphatidyltransferase family protein, partial [Acidimicrobiales bacterium]
SIPAAWAIATGHLIIGMLLLIGSALPDLFDGSLAKASGRSSPRGAFFDSVGDRVSDTVILAGFAWYAQDRFGHHAALVPLAVLGVSQLVSYVRAKADTLGIDAKGGLMERGERVFVLCFALKFPADMLWLLWVIVGLSFLTAAQRFVKVWRQASGAPAKPKAVRTGGAAPATGVVRAMEAAPAEGVTANGVLEEGTEAARKRAPGSAEIGVRWRAWREAAGLTPHPARDPRYRSRRPRRAKPHSTRP